MTLSIYEAALEFSKKSPEELFIHLGNIAGDIFEPIWQDGVFENMEQKKVVLMYIIHAYSKDSPSLIMGASSNKIKNSIADHVGLPDFLRGQVLLLQSQTVRNVALAYMDYQSDRDFTHLMVRKMQYDQMMTATVANTVNDDGKTDFGLLHKITQLTDQIHEDIERLEEKYRSRHAYLYANQEDIKSATPKNNDKGIVSLNIEHSPSISTKNGI